MTDPVPTQDEGFTSAERQKYALLAAVVVLGVTAMWFGLDPIAVIAGLSGLFAGIMIDPHAE